jgi:hypothetical protein
MKKRVLLAIGVAVLIGAGVFASAATLGGITDKNLGASDQVVASCDTDGVTTSYTTRTATGAETSGTVANTTGIHWDVASIKVTGVAAACAGQEIKVVAADEGGATLYESTAQSAVEGLNTFSIATSVPAENVYHVAVVINGVVAA